MTAMEHPGLTVTTYRVDPETGDRIGERTQVLPASETPDVPHQLWPPCQCPRHRKA